MLYGTATTIFFPTLCTNRYGLYFYLTFFFFVKEKINLEANKNVDLEDYLTRRYKNEEDS